MYVCIYVKNWKGFKISLHLQAKKLECYNCITNGRKHEIPGSEMMDFINHAIIIFLTAEPPSQGSLMDEINTGDSPHSLRTLTLGSEHFMVVKGNLTNVDPGERLYLNYIEL